MSGHHNAPVEFLEGTTFLFMPAYERAPDVWLFGTDEAISIHARIWAGTVHGWRNVHLFNFYSCPHMSGHLFLCARLFAWPHFYSCPHMSGHLDGYRNAVRNAISIHARIWAGTRIHREDHSILWISIHARIWVGTKRPSTVRTVGRISIHARIWAGTQNPQNLWWVFRFLFMPAYEWALGLKTGMGWAFWFLFMPAYERAPLFPYLLF